MNNNENTNSTEVKFKDWELLPEGLHVDDMEPESLLSEDTTVWDKGPEPRDGEWEDDKSERIYTDDTEPEATPFLTEDNLWEDMHDTSDW